MRCERGDICCSPFNVVVSDHRSKMFCFRFDILSPGFVLGCWWCSYLLEDICRVLINESNPPIIKELSNQFKTNLYAIYHDDQIKRFD